jgi:predicted outer membrane protein
MLRTRLAAVIVPLFISGVAFADKPATGGAETTEQAAKLSGTFSTLEAVNNWSAKLSEMADKRAKSDLVKQYARSIAAGNNSVDQKLQATAQKHGIEMTPLNTQTEEGKSLQDRMKGETDLLGSLEGDAWDKEYMTLVTNTQQSVLHLLEASKASAKDQDVKQLFGDLTTTVQNRLKTAQDIMTKIYGNQI